MKRLFRGGTVVSGSAAFPADVLCDGEKIIRVAPEIAESADEVVDCSGKLLLPGFIDAHTHFDLDVCNTTTADDFYSGSRAALRGGTTTVIDFACPNKGESLRYGLELWHKKAEKCQCDYGFHMTIDDWNESIEAELDDMFAEGIPTFKMYMTYPAMMIGDGPMYEAMKAIHARGGLCGVHCENSGVIDSLVAEKKAAGENSVGCHPETRPDYLEAEAVSRLLRIAQAADSPIIIVHTTNAAAMEEVAHARERGQTVYVETCPQYLTLDRSCYYQEDWLESAKYVCSPPLRTEYDQAVLWQGLRDGAVQTVSTDHCSFTTTQKLAGKDSFTAIPGGMPGVESRGEVVYTAGVASGRIDLPTFVRALSENPARLYGLYPRKGVLQEGSDADIVIYDPAADHVLTAEGTASRCDYSPYEGFKTVGSIEQVYLRNALAVNHGVVQETQGIYLKRGASTL